MVAVLEAPAATRGRGTRLDWEAQVKPVAPVVDIPLGDVPVTTTEAAPRPDVESRLLDMMERMNTRFERLEAQVGAPITPQTFRPMSPDPSVPPAPRQTTTSQVGGLVGGLPASIRPSHPEADLISQRSAMVSDVKGMKAGQERFGSDTLPFVGGLPPSATAMYLHQFPKPFNVGDFVRINPDAKPWGSHPKTGPYWREKLEQYGTQGIGQIVKVYTAIHSNGQWKYHVKGTGLATSNSGVLEIYGYELLPYSPPNRALPDFTPEQLEQIAAMVRQQGQG